VRSPASNAAARSPRDDAAGDESSTASSNRSGGTRPPQPRHPRRPTGRNPTRTRNRRATVVHHDSSAHPSVCAVISDAPTAIRTAMPSRVSRAATHGTHPSPGGSRRPDTMTLCTRPGRSQPL
jgi:hypothetical protein